jgi:hypothetical protein
VALELPKFNIMTVDHCLRLLDRGFIVLADQTDGLNKMTVSSYDVDSIIRHRMQLPRGFDLGRRNDAVR